MYGGRKGKERKGGLAPHTPNAPNSCVLQDLVGDKTEHIFDEHFWTGLDLVCNALDNMKARFYVDGRGARTTVAERQGMGEGRGGDGDGVSHFNGFCFCKQEKRRHLLGFLSFALFAMFALCASAFTKYVAVVHKAHKASAYNTKYAAVVVVVVYSPSLVCP